MGKMKPEILEDLKTLNPENLEDYYCFTFAKKLEENPEWQQLLEDEKKIFFGVDSGTGPDSSPFNGPVKHCPRCSKLREVDAFKYGLCGFCGGDKDGKTNR